MAEQIFSIVSGFYDAINNDRVYTATDMNRPYKRIISEGVFATPQGTASTDLQTLSAQSGLNIIVKKGEGLLASKWFESTSDLQIAVPANTGIVPRRDSVILQVNTKQSGRNASIIYRTGTPSSNPQPPELSTDSTIVERRLSNIYVAAGANYIGNDAIVDLRGSSECPWITSLIKQVDTSQLYNQWQAAYQAYYNNTTEEFDEYAEAKRTAFDEFVQSLTEELTVTTNVILLESNYTTSGTVSTVPIGIPSFDKSTYILQVFVNGLKATGYTISNDSSSITLSTPLIGDQNVYFVVFKSVVTGDIESCLSAIQTLNARITTLHSDTGWINFSLESGATSYDANTTPGIRKYGNEVFIRGAIKGLNTLNSPICTLPTNCVPAKPHYYSAVVGSVMCTLKVANDVRIVAKSGNIQTTELLPIATSFVVG